MNIVIIGAVWPEITSSAAGLRHQNLIDFFLKENWKVTYLSSSKTNEHTEHLNQQGVKTLPIELNCSSFNDIIKNISPDVVIFDRFITEEQFGWRVHQVCPNCVHILDTQDLHFLRNCRKKALELNTSLDDIASAKISFDMDFTYRELASILRSDLCLMISDFEYDLLINQFKIPKEILTLLRFSYDNIAEQPSFEQRNHYSMIGNFRHAPNADSIHWFSKEIWPNIRKQLPTAEVHIYGAYPPKEFTSMSNPDIGFLVKGWTPNQMETLKKYRVNLAPLRFGAGIKGKISDSWFAGTPSVTTQIGAEGMYENLPFGGEITNCSNEFIQKAVSIYQNSNQWSLLQKNGFDILKNLYNFETNKNSIIRAIVDLKNNIKSFRHKNIYRNILFHHTLQSSKYLSKWIEEKNKLK